MLMVSSDYLIPKDTTDDEASEHRLVLQLVAEIAVKANATFGTSPLAQLFPLVRACENGASTDTTWFRSAEAPLGVDGNFRIDLAQLVDRSLTEAVAAVYAQAECFMALEDFSSVVEEARKRLDAEFAQFSWLMKLHEIAIVIEDDKPQLLAEFSMLDDELEIRPTIQISESPGGLVDAVRYAASWHNHRLAILHEKRAKKCSLFVDACAQAAIAWGGLSIADVVAQVKSESWISVPLMRGNVSVATAMLYIANCVLTAEIHSAADDWHLKGTDLVLREGLSCPDCIQNAGLQDLMRLLPSLHSCGPSKPHALRWTQEEKRNLRTYYSTLDMGRTPLFLDAITGSMAA